MLAKAANILPSPLYTNTTQTADMTVANTLENESTNTTTTKSQDVTLTNAPPTITTTTTLNSVKSTADMTVDAPAIVAQTTANKAPENGSTSAINHQEPISTTSTPTTNVIAPASLKTTIKTNLTTRALDMNDEKSLNETSSATKPHVPTPSSKARTKSSNNNEVSNTTPIVATNLSVKASPKPTTKRARKKKTDLPSETSNQISLGTPSSPSKTPSSSQAISPNSSRNTTGTNLTPSAGTRLMQRPNSTELTPVKTDKHHAPSKIKSRSSSKDSANTATPQTNSTTNTAKTPPKRSRKKKSDTTNPIQDSDPKTMNKQSLASASGTAMGSMPQTINTSNNKMQYSNLTQDTNNRSYAPNKRKSRSSSKETSNAPNVTAATITPPTPAKRPRKKKNDPPAQTSSNFTTSIKLSNTQPITVNTPLANDTFRSLHNPTDPQDVSNRYYSPTMISSYSNLDTPNAASMINRSSLSRLFTSSSVNGGSGTSNQTNPADDPAKAFEELRDKMWSHLSAWVLEQAQQFDVPSQIATLYLLRSENEKALNRVKDLTMKQDQLVAMHARLDMSGPKLTQHLNSTSPNFSSVVSSLTKSPMSLPTSSPGSAIGKPPITPMGTYNHIPPSGSLGPPGYLDRSSPYSCQPHSGIPNMKPSSISTPSPPIGALMAHRPPSLITVNPSMPNVYPHTMAPLGPNPPGSSNYKRH